MKFKFKLKEPNSEKDTLILFVSEFKEENKRFVYSTGEVINPKNWDEKAKFIYLTGKNKTPIADSIKLQLDRYSTLAVITESERKKTNEQFTADTLKKAFDTEFKKTTTVKNSFFDYFELFKTEKTNQLQWSEGTKKRYKNIQNMLENFEDKKNYKLTFSKIDKKFFALFTEYCLNDLEHINNTFLRNVVFFKTFMRWAVNNKYTYNTAFEKFNRNDSGNHIIKESNTSQVALTIDHLNTLMKHEFKTKSLERVRDIFVLQCVTGMRYGELYLINRSNVTENEIVLKEEKGVFKAPRNIPLTALSKYILSKYDYDLPLIANQKQNKYIKDVFLRKISCRTCLESAWNIKMSSFVNSCNDSHLPLINKVIRSSGIPFIWVIGARLNSAEALMLNAFCIYFFNVSSNQSFSEMLPQRCISSFSESKFSCFHT